MGYPKYWADVISKVERQTHRFSFNCCPALIVGYMKMSDCHAPSGNKRSIVICVGRPLVRASLFYSRNKSSCLPATRNMYSLLFAFCGLIVAKHLSLALCTAEKMRELQEAERAYERLVTGREKGSTLSPHTFIL